MSPCELVAAQIGEMFQCSTTNRGHVRIRTPFYYPDGGIVDLFLVQHPNANSVITDFGEALGWLRLQSVGGRRSPKQEKLVQDVCQTHGVELFKGQIVARVPSQDRLAETLFRVSQAAVRLTDLWFTMRTRAVESTTDEVADFLDEKSIRYAKAERLLGRSGRAWQVDFHTFTVDRSALVFVLASGSRAAARRVTEHVLAGWVDLANLKAGQAPLHFVSLFDDTSDIWAEEDFKLVEDVSEVARWTRPDEFEHVLRAA